MLYRILQDLGSRDPKKRQAALLMARGLPWEDLQQFLVLYNRGQQSARRNPWLLALSLLALDLTLLLLFRKELAANHLLLPAAFVSLFIPFQIAFQGALTATRTRQSLATIMDEMDDPAFVPIALFLFSDPGLEDRYFHAKAWEATRRLLPEVSPERVQDWTPEERAALSEGLQHVLPPREGGKDSLALSTAEAPLAILQVLEWIGDARELEILRKVATLEPATDRHQQVRDAAEACLHHISTRVQKQNPLASNPFAVTETPLSRPVNRTEVDLKQLLGSRSTPRP